MATRKDAAMTELVTTTPDRPKRDKVRMVADDVVTANSLATHLGIHRCAVRSPLPPSAAPRSALSYDQTASRLRYIKHLRSEHDAAHVAVKTEMLQLRPDGEET